MSKNKKVSLEMLYLTSDLGVIKWETLNTVFRHNPIVSKLDTRTLNEDEPQDNKRFSKRSGKLCNVAKSVTFKTEELPSNTYQTLNFNSQRTSRIHSRNYG